MLVPLVDPFKYTGQLFLSHSFVYYQIHSSSKTNPSLVYVHLFLSLSLSIALSYCTISRLVSPSQFPPTFGSFASTEHTTIDSVAIYCWLLRLDSEIYRETERREREWAGEGRANERSGLRVRIAHCCGNTERGGSVAYISWKLHHRVRRTARLVFSMTRWPPAAAVAAAAVQLLKKKKKKKT